MHKCSASHWVEWPSRAYRRQLIAVREKSAGKKNNNLKALIPLPPTGLVSFFCANSNVVQTILQPRRAVGLCRGSAIAQNERFGRKNEARLHNATAGSRERVNAEVPGFTGRKIEKPSFYRVFKIVSGQKAAGFQGDKLVSGLPASLALTGSQADPPISPRCTAKREVRRSCT